MISSWGVMGWSAAVVLGLFGCILMVRSPRIAFSVFLVSYLIPLSLWGTTSSGFVVDTRPLGIVALGCQTLHLAARSRPKIRPLDRRNKIAAGAYFMSTLALASGTWSNDPGRSAQSGLAWLVLGVALFVFSRRLPPPEIHTVVALLLLSVTFSSAVACLIAFPDAFNAGRARGIMFNSNGLGLVCALSLPVLLTSKSTLLRLSSPVPLLLIVLTQSRASAAAAIVGVGVIVIYRMRTWARWILVPTGAALILTLSQGIIEIISSSDVLLLRGNNSRADIWALALAQIQDNPLLGVGFGALQSESGSSYLKLLSEMGALGATAGLLLIGAMIAAARGSALMSSLLAVSLVDAAFEGWLFVAGSLYCAVLMFFLYTNYMTVELAGVDNDLMGGNRANSAIRRSPQPTCENAPPIPAGALP